MKNSTKFLLISLAFILAVGIIIQKTAYSSAKIEFLEEINCYGSDLIKWTKELKEFNALVISGNIKVKMDGSYDQMVIKAPEAIREKLKVEYKESKLMISTKYGRFIDCDIHVFLPFHELKGLSMFGLSAFNSISKMSRLTNIEASGMAKIILDSIVQEHIVATTSDNAQIDFLYAEIDSMDIVTTDHSQIKVQNEGASSVYLKASGHSSFEMGDCLNLAGRCTEASKIICSSVQFSKLKALGAGGIVVQKGLE